MGRSLAPINPADLFTKHFEEKISLNHTTSPGFNTAEGRAEDAPQLHAISAGLDEYLNGGNHGEWKLIPYLWGKKPDTVISNNGNPKYGDVNLVSGLRRVTDAVSQVFWGSKGLCLG